MQHAEQCIGDLASAHIKRRPVDKDPNSRATYTKIKSWINECKTSHAKCQWSGRDEAASRLINVGLSGSTQEPHVVLTEGRVFKYLALSYCWGTKQPVVTKEKNLNDHLRSLPISMLPYTIRDAITITRRLGVEYLWVDALCIV